MQVTVELIENDIKGMEGQVEQFKAQLAQASGALATLKGIKEYLNKPDPELEKVEVPPVADNSGTVTVGQKGDNLIVDANGKYHAAEDVA